MSALSSVGFSSPLDSSALSSSALSSSLPAINQANEPADIRKGNKAAQSAYQEALGFEQILVGQLSQALSSTVTSPGDSSGDGSDDSSDSSDSSGGILGSDPSTSAFANMIPQALTTSIMSGGGLGIADQLAKSLDPAIGTPAGEATTSASASSSGSGTASTASTATTGGANL
jgi:Rod binding domain-containing protein